jgi:tRNA(His) 5'-end guanylyltransferase
MLGSYAWLARLADKVRAKHARTDGEYVAYCPLSTGFLQRAGVHAADFDRLVKSGASDDDIVHYFDEHVDQAHRDAANSFVLNDMASHLDEQDAEERLTSR